MANRPKSPGMVCFLTVLGCVGASFGLMALAVDNLVKYLFGPGYFWLIGGPIIAALWAYQSFCVEDIRQ